MNPKTKKESIKDALAKLGERKLREFVEQLLDRREEPWVARCDVEGQDHLRVTNVLVSAFTEARAPQVAAEILRKIRCNDEAERLVKETGGESSQPGSNDNSETKACVDKGDPTFQKTSNGELDTKPSQEARSHVAGRWPLAPAGPPVKKPEEVAAEARACVLSEGGDSSNDRLVLSRYTLQFGQYRDKTYKWLLENDVTYAANLVASHQKEREHTKRLDPLMANKDALTRYVMAYPEVVREVKFHCEYEKAKERSHQSGQAGSALVGFGKYRSKTLKGLYESKDWDEIRYVDFLRGMKSTCDQGSKMEEAIKYILKRDKQRAAAKKRQTRENQVQSTRGLSTVASRPVQKKQKSSRRT
ncbi:uncharacterized protein [Trachinotus anak]|uniref:uncharacterized protein n=1 Tax=Trachinotus anak TaxID=443729 RepID=UPI0039F1EAB4